MVAQPQQSGAGDGACCPVCGATAFAFAPVLPARLIAEWELTPQEAAYVDRQQGEHCTTCFANLRSMVLADALRAVWGTALPLRAWCAAGPPHRVLELNPAGTLHPWLTLLPGHRLAAWPEVDMQALPFPDGSFDTVVHSDTLEHIPDPLQAMRECLRITRPGGTVCYTVPIIVGRLGRSRAGLPPSHHGPAGTSREDYRVHTEFGADAWTLPMQAGAREVRLFTRAHPAAQAIVAVRGTVGAATGDSDLAVRLAAELAALRASTSWRITAPLRWIGRVLRRR